MIINAIIPDQTVVIDGEGRHCPDLVAPDDWAHAYAWDGEIGRVEPEIKSGRDPEWFDDVARMQPFIEAWERAAPVEEELVLP